jgi:hypothetical protein
VASVLITASGEQSHRGDVGLWVYVGGDGQLHGPELRQMLDVLATARTLIDDLNKPPIAAVSN